MAPPGDEPERDLGPTPRVPHRRIPSRRDIREWRVWEPWWYDDFQLPPEQARVVLRKGDAVRMMGLEFIWSDEHKSAQQLQPLRLIGDPPVDAVVPLLGGGFGEDVLPVSRG
jgi:hypothetical protein